GRRRAAHASRTAWGTPRCGRLAPSATSPYGGQTPMPALLLVRHCESSGPEPDAPLTERGRGQAASLARVLARYAIDALVTSPSLRARESIAAFAESSGLTVGLDARLAERRMASGRIVAWRDVVRLSFDDLDHRLPGGESGRETLARGRDAIEDLFAS